MRDSLIKEFLSVKQKDNSLSKKPQNYKKK